MSQPGHNTNSSRLAFLKLGPAFAIVALLFTAPSGYAQNTGPVKESELAYSYEFTGVYQLGGQWHFLLSHRRETKSFWITPQQSNYGCSVVDFNPEKGILTIEYSGRREVLGLKKTGDWQPMAVAGQDISGEQTVAATPPPQQPIHRSAFSKNPSLRTNNLKFRRELVKRQQERRVAAAAPVTTQSIKEGSSSTPGNKLPESGPLLNDSKEQSAAPDFQKYKDALKRGEVSPVPTPVLSDKPPAAK